MKRNLIILLVVILALAGGLIYFTKDEAIFSKETSLYKAVPVSAPVFVEIKDLRSLPFDHPMVKEIVKLDKDLLYLKEASLIDSLIKNNRGVPNSLRDESFLVAFDFVGEKSIFPLIVTKSGNGNKKAALENLISVVYPSSRYAVSSENYSKYKISSVVNKGNNNAVFHFCFADGLFLASPKSLLIEECLRQMNKQKVADDALFKKVNKTVTAQSRISWYINHQTFPDMVSVWLNGHSVSGTNEFGEKVRRNFRNDFKNFKNYAAWSELDMDFDENEIIFNGITASADSLNQFLSVFNGQEPVKFQADQVLPRNTSFFTSYAVSDKSLFFEKLEEYFTHNGNYYKREDRLKKIESDFNVDIKSFFQGLVKNEIIVAGTSVPADPKNIQTLFIIQTKGKKDTELQFIDLLNTYAERKKAALKDMKSTFRIDDNNQFDIYKFPFPSLPGIWLGKPFGFQEANFVTIYDDYLVFSNTENGLKAYLYDMVSGAVLSKDMSYIRLGQSNMSRVNINAYVNINRIFTIYKEVFEENTAGEIKKYEDQMRRFGILNWQVASEKEIVFNSLQLTVYDEEEIQPQTTWQCKTGNRIINKPVLVINHNDKKNNDIIVQDSENNLLQITNQGKVRWKIPVSGQILSDIHQVDYYMNGKLQYLFNTENNLYLIDREGNNVAHFPVEFRSPATNGVNVFDYNKNRDYRYFVACEDKKIYALNRDGKVLNGWNFGETDSEVTTPVKHFRVSNKDYIVFKDKSKIYIQNRRGETRISTSVEFENSKNELFLDLNDKPKIICTDINGNVYYLFFDGKFKKIKTDNFGPDHFFVADDIDGNGIPDFIFADGKELKVLNEKGKKLFTERFKSEIISRPNIYSFGTGTKKIGIVEAMANRIYLFDPSGEMHEGFPLQGSSEFSIGNITNRSDQLSLLVGAKDEYLYNYALN